MPTPDPTLGLNTGAQVAYTGNTLATASCEVAFGDYVDLLNLATHSAVEVEAVLRIRNDLSPLSTIYDPADEDTYYKFVHGDTTFGETLTDAAAVETHNEDLSVAYGGGLLDGESGDHHWYAAFRRKWLGLNGNVDNRYVKYIIEFIMQRMFSPEQTGLEVGLPKAYLRTDIFSEEKVQSEVLNLVNIDKLSKCAFRNWLDPSNINEDSDFITTHRSSQDNSILGYSVNPDGIKSGDMLVLNVSFVPTPVVGFETKTRTLRVEFIHDESKRCTTWSFANQVVYTATGVASEDVAGGGLDDEGTAQ